MGDKYNGWTNWETWNFKLWIDNEESSYSAVLEIAERYEGEPYDFSIELEALADEMLEGVEVQAGFFADVCNSSIKEINFYEIAEAYLRDLEGEA